MGTYSVHMQTIQTEAAKAVEQAMAEAERSRKWTADKSGIAISTFTRKLAGGSDFTIGELRRIAAVLGIHPSRLLPSDFIATAETPSAA